VVGIGWELEAEDSARVDPWEPDVAVDQFQTWLRARNEVRGWQSHYFRQGIFARD
jgi:hypothetical protein